MILEHAPLDVRPGQATEFERAFGEAKAIIASMPGFLRLSLSRGIERPSAYLLLVEWDRLEDHWRVLEAPGSTKIGAAFCTISTIHCRRLTTTGQLSTCRSGSQRTLIASRCGGGTGRS